MRAGILAIGTELLMGETVNTNATYLSKELTAIGIGVYYHYTIGDNVERITQHFVSLLDTCDVIFTTGGLGPTLDDITKEVVAKALNLEMVMDPHSLQLIKERFSMFNKVMPESNTRQAIFPEGAIILDNHQGTAPACILKVIHHDKEKHVIILPGPPRELKHLFEMYVLDYLTQLSTVKFHSVYLSVYDYGESSVEATLMDLFESQSNPTIATYAAEGKVLLRITASGNDEKLNVDKVNALVETVKSRLGHHIVSDAGEDLERVVSNMLIEKGLTLSVAESCTGGLLASTLVKNAGASEFLKAGYITYSNDAKMNDLGVKAETLKQFGAVSHQTCSEMVKGLVNKTQTDIGISITGIAGPSGGTPLKPVGLIYIGLSYKGEVITIEAKLTGDREMIQKRSVIKALKILYNHLIEI